MKISGAVLWILLVQTSASFFDTIHGAMSAVEDSFGSLFSDVVTDVKVTIDCSILAVERVLGLGGILSESPDYVQRCQGSSNIQVTEAPYVTEETEVLSQQFSIKLEESIIKVNNTLSTFLDEDSETRARIDSVKDLLKRETDRLIELSELLRKELDSIRIKFTLPNYSTDPDLPSIWNEMRILRGIEQEYKDSPEAKEISQTFNEALNIMKINKPDKISSDSAIDYILNNISDSSNDSSVEPKPDYELKKNNTFEQNNVTNNNSSNKFPRSFKDLFNKESQTVKAQNNSEKVDKSEESFLTPKDPIEALKVADAIIDSSRENAAVMSDYLNEATSNGVTVFDESLANQSMSTNLWTETTVTQKSPVQEITTQDYKSITNDEVLKSASSIMAESQDDEAMVNAFLNKASNSGVDVFS